MGISNFNLFFSKRFDHILKELDKELVLPSIYVLKDKKYYKCSDCLENVSFEDKTREFISKLQKDELEVVYKSEESENVTHHINLTKFKGIIIQFF
jgi:hypothetical protein